MAVPGRKGSSGLKDAAAKAADTPGLSGNAAIPLRASLYKEGRGENVLSQRAVPHRKNTG